MLTAAMRIRAERRNAQKETPETEVPRAVAL
jgi:hypothetical protein